MLRNMLSSRGLIAGIIFFVLIVGGTQLYSWHVRRSIEAELAPTKRAMQPLENQKGPRTAEDASVPTDTETLGQTEMPLSTENTQMMSEAPDAGRIDDTESFDIADAFLLDDAPSMEDLRDVPVSPFGFGPYPEVPADYPSEMQPSWLDPNRRNSRNHELMHRVLIKLWNQGDKNVSGAVMRRGLVYPLYPNTVYVKYKYIEMPDGTVRRVISHASGTRATKLIERPGEFPIPVLPDGVSEIDMETAGINPYDFLYLR